MVILFSKSLVHIVELSLLISTKTGLKLVLITENKVEHQVIAGKIISEFLGKFKLSIARIRASVPFAQPTPYFTPQYFAKLTSKSFTSFPKIKLLF